MAVKRARGEAGRNSTAEAAATNSMWGGRFSRAPADIMARINASIAFDKRLHAQDIAGSRAHCNMLAAQGILGAADARAILKGLDQVEREIAEGRFEWRLEREDIHMHVEARLAELIGEPAGRLHTARSRNDQVATDFRLWVRDALDRLDADLLDLQRALLERAEEHAATIMPGFTHLQAAQPVTLGHHLLGYVEMFGRDRGRAADARARLNESPLGAGALAGTSFPLDRRATAAALGFARPMANSLDAVSARDFALEYLAAAAICATHLSRLAEELVLWSSAQFRFVRLSDAFTTGSSMMPQKRNPDAAELTRAKAGRVIGDLTALLVVMKGLPLAYSKDMQEDKEPVFDAADALALALPATAGMVRDMAVDEAAMRAAAGIGFTTATDLADWLVQALGVPFRQSHHIAGRVVRRAEETGVGLEALSLAELQAIEPRVTKQALARLTVEASVESRTSFGGTAPKNVRAQVKAWKKRLG